MMTWGKTWIAMADGLAFDPFAPTVESIRIEDIARGLSRICRFGGHTREFYSVAQHSVLCSRVASLGYEMEALLHDAHEALDGLGDLCAPVKKNYPGMGEHGDRVQRAVCERYGLRWPMSDEVKAVDSILLRSEARDVMVGAEAWGLEGPRLVQRIMPWSMACAEQEFLRRFEELGDARQG